MYQTAFDLYTVNTPKMPDMQNVEEHTIVLYSLIEQSQKI